MATSKNTTPEEDNGGNFDVEVDKRKKKEKFTHKADGVVFPGKKVEVKVEKSKISNETSITNSSPFSLSAESLMSRLRGYACLR